MKFKIHLTNKNYLVAKAKRIAVDYVEYVPGIRSDKVHYLALIHYIFIDLKVTRRSFRTPKKIYRISCDKNDPLNKISKKEKRCILEFPSSGIPGISYLKTRRNYKYSVKIDAFNKFNMVMPVLYKDIKEVNAVINSKFNPDELEQTNFSHIGNYKKWEKRAHKEIEIIKY